MNKIYQKVVFVFLIAILLNVYNVEYWYIYMIGVFGIMLYLVHDNNVYYHNQLDGYKRQKDNVIKEVEDLKDFNYKVLRSLIRTMDLPMIFINNEGIIMFTNQSFRDAFDIKHLRGKQYKEVFSGPLFDVVNQSYIFERKLSIIENINERIYQIEATPVFKDEVVFDGSIILFTDISKVKEMEKMQKQFFSDISHELKTPLSAIIGSVEILKEQGTQDQETFNEFMAILLKESYRMQNIINDILELSRLDKPKVTLDYQMINIQDIIKETIDLFDPWAKDKHLSIMYENKVDEELMLDYSSIKTIISNLVSNSVKYSDSGIIYIRTRVEDNHLVLSVQDEGLGISEKDIPFIFDRFFQVDRSRSKKNGTGLGLSIVQRMVDINKGTIDVESNLGVGTTFTIKLPLNK